MILNNGNKPDNEQFFKSSFSEEIYPPILLLGASLIILIHLQEIDVIRELENTSFRQPCEYDAVIGACVDRQGPPCPRLGRG